MAKYTGAKPDEVFLGNTETNRGIPDHLSGLKTVRLGEQALDIYGHKIPADHMLPMFINRSESDAYDRLMTQRFSEIRRGQT